MVRETRYLIVRNLPENCTEETVIDHFQRYGKIQSVKLQAAKDNDSGSTATVAFNDIKSAAKAHHAKNSLGEVTLRTDYWEGSTSTPVIAPAPVATSNAVRSAIYTTVVTTASTRPVSAFPNWTKGTEEEGSALQDKGESTPSQPLGVSTTATATSALEKLSSTPSFDRGRTRERFTNKKKFGKFENRNGSFGRHGTTTSSRSLEAARSQSEAAAAAAAAAAASSATQAATTTTSAGTGSNSNSGSTSGLNPIIVSDTRDCGNKDVKENNKDSTLSRPHSVASPSSRHSGLKKSQSQSRSVSGSRSRSHGSKSSSSRSDSSGTSRSTSPHRSYSSSTARPQSMVGASRLVSSEIKDAKREDDGERKPLGICITGLPMRSTDSSLRDGLYHEYKKHGKVTTVQICVDGDSRYAIVSFKKPEDASKALEASQGKVFFGSKIKVTSHEGIEVDDSDVTNDNDSLDEYHLKSTRTLFVGNLEKETTKEDLIEKFQQFGEIIDVDIKRQGATTAFAFVQYVDITSVVAALRAMEGEHIGINKIKESKSIYSNRGLSLKQLGFGKSMPTCCVWVDNLPADTNSRSLKNLMSRYGEITHCLVDKNRNRGLIYFNSYDHAQHCVSDIKMRPHFSKKKLQIDFASRECQTNFLDRMEESGQLRANERPDESRVLSKFRQQRSFDGFPEEGSPSSYGYNSRTPGSFSSRNGRSSRRSRQYVDPAFPEEPPASSRRSRRPEDYTPSSAYYSSKGNADDYDAVLRDYGHSQRERRERDSPRHSSADRRVDSQSRRGSRDHSLDRYEDRQKERAVDIFSNRGVSPSSEHNSYHSENRYRSSRDEKYLSRDRFEDRKSEDKDFDRHSRPSRTASPFLQNHASLHSHDSDFNRRGGSRSQSPTTPLQEEAGSRFYSDDYKHSVGTEDDYSPHLPLKRKDSESKSWLMPSNKLGAEVAKTVEKSRKRTHEESGLSDSFKLDSKLSRKLEKPGSLSEDKIKYIHRQLSGSKRRELKSLDHGSSPGSSESRGDSENGSASEGDLHHLHQEKEHILLKLQEFDEEVTSEPESPQSTAKVKSVAVKDALRNSGRSHEDKRYDEASYKSELHRRHGEKVRRLDSKRELRNHISDDVTSREDKAEKDESIEGNSDSGFDFDLRTKKRRPELHRDSDSMKVKNYLQESGEISEEEEMDRKSEKNVRIHNSSLDRRGTCDSRTNSMSSKFYDDSKVTHVSSPCDSSDPFKGGISDNDLSVITPYRTSSISNSHFPQKDWSSSVPESSPLGNFSPAYSEENTQDSVTSGSLTDKSSKHSLPASPTGKDYSDNDFSYSKLKNSTLPENYSSDDSMTDVHQNPGEQSVEERIRAIDEILNMTTSNKPLESLHLVLPPSNITNNNDNTGEYFKKFRIRKREGGIEGGNGSLLADKKPEPSVIMQQVLSKKSILDQDFRRLRNNDKFEPTIGKDHSLQTLALKTEITSPKLLDIKGELKSVSSYLSFSSSYPVTTSSSMLQPTITTSMASSVSLTAPISTSVLTSPIVSSPITISSINVSTKTVAVDNTLLSSVLESSNNPVGFLSDKLLVSTNSLTLKQDVTYSSKCLLTLPNSSLTSKPVCGVVQCTTTDSVADSNLLTSQSSLQSSLSHRPISSTLSTTSLLTSTLSSISNKQQTVSSLPTTSCSSLSTVTKSPSGATVAAPFTQGPDKSQLTPTVGQEAPRLCSPSFTPENSRTSVSSHLPGSRSPRITTHKQDDPHVPSNKPELTISVSGQTHISKSNDDLKGHPSLSKADVISPDIESPVSVKSETSSNSSVPLSSHENKAHLALEEKNLTSCISHSSHASKPENNNSLSLKVPVSNEDALIKSVKSTLDIPSTRDSSSDVGLESLTNMIKILPDDMSSKRPELSPASSTQVVLSVGSKDNSEKRELSSPTGGTSNCGKVKPISSSLSLNSEVEIPIVPVSSKSTVSNVASTSSSTIITPRPSIDRSEKKSGKSNSHSHMKSPAKSEALFAPDVKVELKLNEKTEGKHLSKDSHKSSSSSSTKLGTNSGGDKKLSKLPSKESQDTKASLSNKDQDKSEKKSDNTHKISSHDSASKAKESEKNKGKDKREHSKDGEKNKPKEKEDVKKKEERKPSAEKKDDQKVSSKEDKKIDKKVEDKKEKTEKSKGKEGSKLNIFKKIKSDIDLSKKDKKQKPKDVHIKEKQVDKKLPILACITKNSTPEVKLKESSKSETKDPKQGRNESKDLSAKDGSSKVESTKIDQKTPSKPDSKNKVDSKSNTKASNDLKSENKDSSSSLNKRQMVDSSKQKKESEGSKQSVSKQDKPQVQKVKPKDDKLKEKQKLKEEKEKLRLEKEKLREEKEKEREKEKEKERQEKEQRERDEKEKQKEKEEREKKELEEKERKEKEEKERKEREEKDRREKEEREKKEREEKERLRREKEERERQKEKEREEREKREREERDRKEREEKERLRKERDDKLKQKEEKEALKEKERLEKERQERERKEKEEKDRQKEKEEKEKLKDKEEKEKQKEKEENSEKDKIKEKEKKDKERKEKEKKEKRDKEKKAKEDKLRKEKEERAKKEKEDKTKKEEKEKAKKEKLAKKDKDKKQKSEKDDDDDKDDKERKKPPPKKPKRNELAVLLDSNDRFQMTFTSMYDRVKTQRNREPEQQQKVEPAPKSSFDKFKQNRKKKGSKARSSLYSCGGSTSELSDDSDLSGSETSQKAEPIKETKSKKTSHIKKRPHVSSSSSSSCEEDDDALLRASKPKGKKTDKFSEIFSSDSEEDNFQTPSSKSKVSSKIKSKPPPKRRKTIDDSSDSKEEGFAKPHAMSSVTEPDSLDDIDMSEDDIPKQSVKKTNKTTKRLDKSSDQDKRESSVESVSKKITKIERESSVESVSKKSTKSDKEGTPSKKLKQADFKKSVKSERENESKAFVDSKASIKEDVKTPVTDKKKGKSILEPTKEKKESKKESDTGSKKEIVSKKDFDSKKETESKKELVSKKDENKKDFDTKKETESRKDTDKKEIDDKKEAELKRDFEIKKDSESKKDLEQEKANSTKEKAQEDLNLKYPDDRKKKKDKDEGPTKKKKKKKYDPKEEEELVNSLITKVYDKALDKEKKLKKKSKPNIFDSDSDMGLSETSFEILEEKVPVLPTKEKTDTEMQKSKEKKREGSKDKEVMKDKDANKSEKHFSKETKSIVEMTKKPEKKKAKEMHSEKELEKNSTLSQKKEKREKEKQPELIDVKLITEVEPEILEDSQVKQPKKKKKKKDHEKDIDKEKPSKSAKKSNEQKTESEKKISENEKKASSSSDENSVPSSQVVDEFVSFWGHPKPILIPKRLKDTTKNDDDKAKNKDKDDAKLECGSDKLDSTSKTKEITVKEEKNSSEKPEHTSGCDKIVKVESEANEDFVVPISEAETIVTTELTQAAPVINLPQVGSHNAQEEPMSVSEEDFIGLPDETTIGSSVEIHDDDDYPLLVIDEVSETVTDEKKKMTKKEKKLLKQKQEKERNDRMDEVIASVANAGSSDEEDVAKCSPVSLQIDSVGNDRELVLSDVINQELKYDNKMSNEPDSNNSMISDIVFPDKDDKKSSETSPSFSGNHKDKKDAKTVIGSTMKKEGEDKKHQKTNILNEDLIKREDGLVKNFSVVTDTPLEKPVAPEEIKLSEEDIKKQLEEEKRKAEEEKKKAEEEDKARHEKEEQALKEASDEAARAVESLLEFQSGFEQEPIDLDDDLPPLYIEPAEKEPTTETVILSPAKDTLETVTLFSNAIPEKLTANLDDKLLEVKTLEKDQGENKIDAFSFFATPPQAVASGFTSPRRNSTTKDKTPEPVTTMPSPQRQKQSPQRQIPPSPQIQSPQRQMPSPQRQMPSPQRQMQSPQRQMTSPQRIQSPQRPPLQSTQLPMQSPLRPMHSPQIGLQSPLQSPQRSPFFSNKDSKLERSLISPNRDIFVLHDIDTPAVQQPQRRLSSGLSVLPTPEQLIDPTSAPRTKSLEFTPEQIFHSPRRNTIAAPEEVASTHMDHRFSQHQGANIYPKEHSLCQSSLPPPVSISLDNAPHDKNFQTPMRSLTIPPHQENVLLSPKKNSPVIHFKDIAPDPSIFTSTNKGPLQEQLFQPSKTMLHEQLFAHHPKSSPQDQLFHSGKGPMHDLFKTGPSEQQVFLACKGPVLDKQLIYSAKIPESNFPFQKGQVQDSLFPTAKGVQSDRIQEPMFSPKGQTESTYSYPDQPIDFLLNSPPPRNTEFIPYNTSTEVPKPSLTKQMDNLDTFSKDPLFLAMETTPRHKDREPPQPRRLDGFPPSFYQEPVPVAPPKNFHENSNLQQQSGFDDDKKGSRKRKRNNKRTTKEDRAAALAEQQAIEQSVQANVESIHKALNANQAKAAAEKAVVGIDKKKTVDAYDFEAHTGQELGTPRIPVSEAHHASFGEDLKQGRTRADTGRGRGRGTGTRRGRKVRGGLTSGTETQDAIHRHEPFSPQQPHLPSPPTQFQAQQNQDHLPSQKIPYVPFQFSSPPQQPSHPTFQRQTSQPVNHQLQPFYQSPQPSSGSENSSSMSLPEWQIKQMMPPNQLSQTQLQIPPQQQMAKGPPKNEEPSPEPSKQDLDSSFGESELVINLDDQPSSIEGKENQYSLSSDGEVPSPATPKAQRSTRARKQPNYKAIASGTPQSQMQVRSSRSGGSPRGRGIGAQSPKNSMSPRTRSSENVPSSSPVVKLEKLEVPRTTRRRKETVSKFQGKDEMSEEMGPTTSFEDWKAKKVEEIKTTSKENVYEFVDNEQEQSMEPNLRTRARKKRASENQELQSHAATDYVNSPASSSNSNLQPDSKSGFEPPISESRSSEESNRALPLSNVDAVIDAVSKGYFGSSEDDGSIDVPLSVASEPASTPSPVLAPPSTRSSRRSTELKKDADQKEKTTFTIAEPSRFELRDLGKKGPTVPPLRIKVAHGTPKVEKNEEKHYVIERANKNEHNEKPPLAFTVKLSDSGTATIKPVVSGNNAPFSSNLAQIGKSQILDGTLKKENHLGLFSGLPQNEQQQVGEQDPSKVSVSQAPAWKPVDSMVMDTPITRPSSTLHPKVAAKVQASQESLNNVPPVPALVQTSMPQSSQQQSLPLSSIPIHTKSSPGPHLGAHIWTSGLQGSTPSQPSPNTQLPLHLQNTSPLQKDAILLQQLPPSVHLQPTQRNDRSGKGGKHVTIDGNQEMPSKLSADAQKLSEGPFGFAGHVPPVHLGQRSYHIPQEQQGLPSSHLQMHFQSSMFKNNLDIRNVKSPSIQSQSSLKLGTDIGTRTPPVTSAAMLYAGVVSTQPLSLSPTSASPEGQVIERLPNPMRVQGDAGHQSPSPLGLRIHQDSSRFSADDIESHVERAPSREMLFIMEQRLHQHLYIAQEVARNAAQENSRNSNQDPTRSAEVSRPIIRNAHDQPRNTPVGLESGRKNSLTSQPIGHNQPLNLADSDNRGGDSSRGTPKSTPPAPQSPFSLPYLDRKGEPGRLPVGVASAFMQPSPSTHRESLSHIYPDLTMGHPGQFGMVARLPIDPRIYPSGHQPPAHLLASHFPGPFTPNTRFQVLDQYSDKKGEPGHPERGMPGSPSPNTMIRGQGLGLKQQPTRMPCDLPPNSPVGILQRYPVMWQGALALKNDNSYVQMHFIAGNRRLPNLALPQPMHSGALPPLRISQRMRLEQAQLEGVSKRMQCEEDYCILIAVACGRDQSDISLQTRALNDGFITYLLSKQAAGIVNVPYPGSEQAGFVVHIFPPCDFVDNSVAEQGSTVLLEQLRDVPHAVIIIATT